MNFLINFCLNVAVVLKVVLLQVVVEDVALTAITDIPYLYIHKLYSEEVNQDPPNAQWEEKTNSELTSRLRICQEMTDNEIFKFYSKMFVDVAKNEERLHSELLQDRYEEVHRDLFTDGKLTNEFRRHRFNMSTTNVYPRQPNSHLREVFVEDHVFMCLVQREFLEREMIPIYVTKLYKGDSKLHAHRFLLEERNGYLGIMLAEAPAEDYAPPNFFIEAYYQELKKDDATRSASILNSFHILVYSATLPPRSCKCKLTTTDEHYRLCVIVLSSPYFKSKGVAYVRRLEKWGSRVEKFSFRTEKGRELAEESPYPEILTPCDVYMGNHRDDVFYLSRAYRNNEVLVSVQDLSSKKFYLEHRSINIGLINERSISDDVHT